MTVCWYDIRETYLGLGGKRRVIADASSVYAPARPGTTMLPEGGRTILSGFLAFGSPP